MAQKIITAPSFKKNYRQLPWQIQQKVDKQLRFLVGNPYHPSLKMHRLGETGYWEFYIDFPYRAVCRRSEGEVELLFVGTHRLIDRWK
ncbi:MAG: hypothetical protein HY538_04080 [Deltaproteobacteria bacterium]|nr:hypothetical protein [Deltaproteobacteria bacterium]